MQAQLVTGVTLLVTPRIWYKTKEQAKKSADFKSMPAHGLRVETGYKCPPFGESLELY
jgi:hypothetical protein